jgi:uncharacterized protein
MTIDMRKATATPEFVEQTWDLAYRHSMGETVGRFFSGLRQKQILGRRCGQCKRVLVPPRSYCDRCYRATDEWVKVGHRGTVEMYTIVYHQFRHMPPPPYILGYVRLDGSATGLLGYIRGIDAATPESVTNAIGKSATAEIRFLETPVGRVTDYWFELVSH